MASQRKKLFFASLFVSLYILFTLYSVSVLSENANFWLTSAI